LRWDLNSFYLVLTCVLTGVALALVSAGGYFVLRGQRRQAGVSTSTSMRRGEMRDRAMRKSAVFRFTVPWLRVIALMLAQLDFETLRNYVRAPYARAGYPGGLDDDEVVALGLFLGIVVTTFLSLAAILFLGIGYVFLGLLGMPIGFLMLASSLKGQAAARELLMLQALPYMLDLLVLMLRSGSSLRIALARVVEDYENHPLGVELGQVMAEIDAGAPRAAAFRRMADRLKIQDLSAFADSIVQSEELGWPLAETLERLADRLSSERMLRAQSKAGAAGVLVMIPSTLVLAAAVLLLFGPTLVRLMMNGTVIE